MIERSLGDAERSGIPDHTGYEWDEDKRAANKIKHRIDFLDATVVFENSCRWAPALTVNGEERWAATGFLGDALITVIYVIRGSALRIISARRARPNERREYQALFPR